MNIQTPARTVKHALLGALMMTISTGIATTSMAGETTAQATPATSPAFIVEQGGKTVMKKAYRAYSKGDLSKAAGYNTYALQQGLRVKNMVTVHSNQCAIYGELGRYDDAIKACDKALKLAPNHYQAFSNRAAVNWLSGNQTLAKQDIQAAKNLDTVAPQIAHNIKVFG